MVIPKLTLVYDRKKIATKNKAGVVELLISMGKERKYITTGVKVFPHEWKKGSVVAREDWKELNEQLSLMMQGCSEVITRMMREGEIELSAIPRLLEESMVQRQTFIAYAHEIALRKYDKVSQGTKEHYEHWFRFMERWKGIVSFSDVTEKNIRRMDDDLAKKGITKASRWNYHKILKTFIKNAVEDGLLKRNPYARLDIKKCEENGLSKYLSPAEFHRFERCVINSPHLQRVRDLFVFQTYTMMSYSDLQAFRWEDCVRTEDGKFVYKSKRKKTGQEFIIVLLPPAIAILKKYDYKLPIITNIKYNYYLKDAVRYAKISRPVTTHWARHTGATLMLNEGGLSMHVVQHILGHASIRETEKTYAKVLDNTIIEQMSSLKETLPIFTDQQGECVAEKFCTKNHHTYFYVSTS